MDETIKMLEITSNQGDPNSVDKAVIKTITKASKMIEAFNECVTKTNNNERE